MGCEAAELTTWNQCPSILWMQRAVPAQHDNFHGLWILDWGYTHITSQMLMSQQLIKSSPKDLAVFLWVVSTLCPGILTEAIPIRVSDKLQTLMWYKKIPVVPLVITCHLLAKQKYFNVKIKQGSMLMEILKSCLNLGAKEFRCKNLQTEIQYRPIYNFYIDLFLVDNI